MSSYKLTPEECRAFINNDKVNPRTGKPISINGRLYRYFRSQCQPTVKTLNTFNERLNVGEKMDDIIPGVNVEKITLYKLYGINTYGIKDEIKNHGGLWYRYLKTPDKDGAWIITREGYDKLLDDLNNNYTYVPTAASIDS